MRVLIKSPQLDMTPNSKMEQGVQRDSAVEPLASDHARHLFFFFFFLNQIL